MKTEHMMESDRPPLVRFDLVHDGDPVSLSGYRPDIDGLRTFAIVSVLVFHAYPTLLPGGFTGIDICFVVSGFLISGVLSKQHKHRHFSYISFCERRVRRTMPTLIVVLVMTLWLGYIFLRGVPLKHMVATLSSTDVQALSLETASSKHGSNPLLHLWPLGVGGLFYIFWPCVCIVLIKQPYTRAVQLQIAFLALSFLINIIASVEKNHGNMAVFLMPLGRFWQLSMGGLLSYVMAEQATTSLTPLTDSSHFGAWMSAAGLGLVVIGLVFIESQSAFPGIWALLPTAGATLLLAGGPQAPFNRYVLSNTMLMQFGKISYGLYLWHWPLLVISNHQYPPATSRPFTVEPWCMLLVSVALSIITHGEVEHPLRRSTAKWITPAIALCVLGLAAVVVTLHML
ncbi:hypothetical protein SDRG_12020 [Saprolegnia diclina VS20]|uniref:Acyltransferase 3 domain-containing protein n=1 Tax=Saprolegnia diclina (strain VS20) TaxID=1156394 RepID=T0RJT7_SAPDV|nr:hypothetical protein SDRG_12020 [Saprolegnia diclina VS20]EQC30167.1 hypothetical protein SDRG_12020 [Saprolegnia diclina VS20]|eukprot:XP_008616299.1 hypothetical protein SDRG_12020 [Saprolegnia diclina VS20]